MKPIAPPRSILAAASLAALLAGPSTAPAFDVTTANGGSTFNAVKQWAADVGYVVFWEPRNAAGMVDFAAPSRHVHGNFREAVEALVSGAVYERANLYCVPPFEFQAEANVDNRMRLVYVTGHRTGRGCMLHIPRGGIYPLFSPAGRSAARRAHSLTFKTSIY